MDFRHDADSNPALCARCKPPETRSYAAASTVAAPPVPAATLALDVSFTAGLIIYLVLMRRVAGHPVFASVLVTVSLGILLRVVVGAFRIRPRGS